MHHIFHTKTPNTKHQTLDEFDFLRIHQTYKLNRLEITVDRQGAERFAKVNYPIRYGRFCEITAYFLLGNEFSPDHYRSVVDMVRNRLDGFYSKGAIYLSPLTSDQLHRDLLLEFVKIKNMSRLPTYLYLIQRL